ncbi:hypothetical protein [uncultured Thiodictyon sp.]|uniref:hypothetical protein n=1 Tax=uncultured Thiodictyon sp. TaxID=1846217 RepID=UPI0025D9DA62|nr:hypothetical protein [uncultured Thiodictyon sp.]
MDNFSTMSFRVSVSSSSDYHLASYPTHPTVREDLSGVDRRRAVIAWHAIFGRRSVMLPGVTIDKWGGVGGLRPILGCYSGFRVDAEIPARRTAERQRDLLTLDLQLRQRLGAG